MTVPVEPVAATLQASAPEAAPAATRSSSAAFENLLSGLEQIDQQIIDADNLAAAFVTDNTIPPHQVAFALEEARLSTELLLRVRTQLVEGYQEIMRMQL